MKNKLTAMVGAFLFQDDRVLLGFRHPDRTSFPSTWDMIGGHVEPGESADMALRRELQEELGIKDVVLTDPFRNLVDTELGIDLLVWRVDHWFGQVKNIAVEEHLQLDWFAEQTLSSLVFPHPLYLDLIKQAFDLSKSATLLGDLE
jgi:8-oxo-dGTP diphosphatase